MKEDKTDKSNQSDIRKPHEKEADYLHPEGAPNRPPRTTEEMRNEVKAEESTELAETLKPE